LFNLVRLTNAGSDKVWYDAIYVKLSETLCPTFCITVTSTASASTASGHFDMTNISLPHD
jgi:hypothetical protein